MNDVGLFLIGCIVRCTIMAVPGLTLGSVLSRRRPAAGAVVTLTTLVGLLAVPVLGLSPWPHWWTIAPASTANSVAPPRAIAPAPEVASTERSTSSAKREVAPATERPARDSWWSAFAAALDKRQPDPLV